MKIQAEERSRAGSGLRPVTRGAEEGGGPGKLRPRAVPAAAARFRGAASLRHRPARPALLRPRPPALLPSGSLRAGREAAAFHWLRAAAASPSGAVAKW